MAVKTIQEVRAWLTPSLVILVGWFAKNKLEDIEAKLNLIPGMQQQVNVNAASIQLNKEQLNELRTEFVTHVNLSAKSEDEITFEKLKKTK